MFGIQWPWVSRGQYEVAVTAAATAEVEVRVLRKQIVAARKEHEEAYCLLESARRSSEEELRRRLELAEQNYTAADESARRLQEALESVRRTAGERLDKIAGLDTALRNTRTDFELAKADCLIATQARDGLQAELLKTATKLEAAEKERDDAVDVTITYKKSRDAAVSDNEKLRQEFNQRYDAWREAGHKSLSEHAAAVACLEQQIEHLQRNVAAVNEQRDAMMAERDNANAACKQREEDYIYLEKQRCADLETLHGMTRALFIEIGAMMTAQRPDNPS